MQVYEPNTEKGEPTVSFDELPLEEKREEAAYYSTLNDLELK